MVPSSELYYMPPDIMNKFPLALNCQLNDIKPIDGTWSSYSTVYDVSKYLLSGFGWGGRGESFETDGRWNFTTDVSWYLFS